MSKAMAPNDAVTKVHVGLPNHWAADGESIWATELGDDLYELSNVPFYAYDLNFGDVVRATCDEPDLIPEVKQVVRRSGHRTLRLFFREAVDEDKAIDLLESLAPQGVSYEGENKFYFALDLEPNADIDGVRDVLDSWEEQGLIGYETCEARLDGGFDASPDEDNPT